MTGCKEIAGPGSLDPEPAKSFALWKNASHRNPHWREEASMTITKTHPPVKEETRCDIFQLKE